MQRRGFAPLVPEIHHARYGDLESVHALLRTVCPPDELAAIFVEPIQGEGGYIVPPADFLPGPAAALRRARDPARARRGPGGYRPDGQDVRLRALGRRTATSSAWPRGSPTACRWGRSWPGPTVMDWPSGSHASTFGGNPVACAAALATLRLVETRYRANAERRGAAAPRGPGGAGRPPPVHPRGPRARPDDRRRDPGSDGAPDPALRDRIIELAFRQRPAPAPLRRRARSGSARRSA